ncbi:MAG: 2-oxoglutarate dehydrogenase complex dihydrolipoyllysine-residue succinyltransferase [Alphaproteobacteria bacterium]
MISIKTPAMGESIAEATVAKWLVNEGDMVAADQLVAELETDKVNLEVTAPAAGKLVRITAAKGSTVKVGQVMGEVDETVVLAASAKASASQDSSSHGAAVVSALDKSGPAVRKQAAEMGISPSEGSGKDGRVTKADLGAPVAVPPAVATVTTNNQQPTTGTTERVPMTRIRKTIATRLKQAQNTAAMLTTYNEVDLQAVNNLRKTYKDAFEKKHGVKLGFMGFFTKAVCAALEEFPALNAEIDGDDIVYKNYHDIGIAVSSPKGLVVPVVRGAAGKSLAQIEKDIGDFGARSKTGQLKPDELVGATFSITNGGTFGSLMSMPILNYPQVGILGMHAIKDRPVVVDGQIVIRPMMYLALTYDHRIVDGREAVSFLVTVKNMLEDPARFLLGV